MELSWNSGFMLSPISTVSYLSTYAGTLAVGSAWIRGDGQAQISGLTDDGPNINSAIKTAIAKGATEYVLPSGTINLKTSIVVPAGTRNFTLRGAAGNSTLIKTPFGSLDCAIKVGDNIYDHNNWGLTNRPNYACSPVAEGATTIKVLSAGSFAVGANFVVWDQTQLHPTSNSSVTIMNHAEVVKVSAWNSATKTLTLSAPLGRSYSGSVSMAAVDPFICKNITVKDISLDGVGGTVSAACGGLLVVNLADGVNVNNLRVRNYLGWAISFNTTSNVNVYNSYVYDALQQDPGHGYAFTACRSRNVQFLNCQANNNRHGFVAHGGAMDITFTDCVSNQGNFDTHGMEEKRISVLRCTSDKSLALANETWPGGVSGVTVRDSAFGEDLRLNSGTQNVSIYTSKFGPLLMNDLLGGGGAWIQNILVQDSSFTFTEWLIRENARSTGLSFKNCKFQATRKEWGNVLAFRSLAGSMSFDNCDFVQASQRSFDPVILATSTSGSGSVTITNSRMYSDLGADTAVSLASGSAGAIKVAGNAFKTRKPTSPTFLKNGGKWSVTNTSNTATATAIAPSSSLTGI